MHARHLHARLLFPTLVGLLVSSFVLPAEAQNRRIDPRLRQVIHQVTQMPHDSQLRQRASRLGLNVVNVMWEDTGRFQGSSVGPNISDLTLQVREPIGGDRYRTHLLPVIRHPNFSDRTADIPADSIWVRIGNHEEDGELEEVRLTDVLRNLRTVLSDDGSLRGSGNFLAPRDTHFLVSAQHVFMPLPRRGDVEFSPVLFNYQSSPSNPAVLTLLITRQGTSATIIENRPGDQSFQGWGQQLFHNHEGQRTFFTAERRSAVRDRIQRGEAREQDQGALDPGADMVMIVQVPLVHRNVHRGFGGLGAEGYGSGGGGIAPTDSAPTSRSRGARSDVEAAVIGHGEALGPFYEMGGQRLVRDRRFPIRITVQFYRATSNGVVSAQDLRDVHDQIERVYEDGDYVGSLVVPRNAPRRPTDWIRSRNLRRPTEPQWNRWSQWHRSPRVSPYVY